MGKSFLLTRMAQNIMDENPFQLVRFFQFTDFLIKLKQPVTQDSFCNAIADLSSDYEIGRKLVSNAVTSKNTISYLFLDGFDEVSTDQVPIVREIFMCASKLKQTRVYAATRLHMRRELEDITGGFGFTMLPFREEEQIDFLVKFWSDAAPGTAAKLKEFASVCLESLRTVIGDQNIAGIPLVCSIIARIYQNDAVEYYTGQLSTPALSRTVSSIFQMYQVFMTDGFKKLTSIPGYDSKNTDKITKQIKRHLVCLAVEELFPDRSNMIISVLAEIGNELKSFLFLPGILETGIDETSTRFVHRTFAEYLVAELIAEGIKLPSTGVVAKMFSKILPKSRIFDNPHIKELVWKLMFEDVLVTRQKIDSVHLRIGGAEAVTSYEFAQPTICHFLNALDLNMYPSSKLPQPKKYQHQFVSIYTAAVVSDKPAIGKLLAEMFESEYKYLPWSKLFILAAKYAGVEMTKQLTELLRKALLMELSIAHLKNQKVRKTKQHLSTQLKLIDAGADIHTVNIKGLNPFINGMKYGKGLEMTVVNAIEFKHPQFLSEFGGMGLKALLTNSSLMAFDWDESLDEIAKYLIEKGAVVKCRTIESPWNLEQVVSNMSQIVEATELTSGLLQRLKTLEVSIEKTENSTKNEIFEILKEVQGSYEKLMLSLMMCKQIKPFLIMKQCLQADDRDSVWFVTPPPGLLDFIVDKEQRVLILQSYMSKYTAIRICDSFYPDVIVEELGDLSNNECSGGLRVFFCSSQSKVNEMLPKLLSFGAKTVLIIEDNTKLNWLDVNNMKLVRIAYDEVKWNDLSEKVRGKLMSSVGESEDNFSNCDTFVSLLVRNCFEEKNTASDYEIDSLVKFCEIFINFSFRERKSEQHNLLLIKLAIESKFQSWANIFKTIDKIDHSELGVFTPRSCESASGADYFVALMVIDKNYWVYLDTEMFLKFVEFVIFKTELDCHKFVHSNICEYVNLLVKSSGVQTFQELVGMFDESSFANLVSGCVEVSYLEMLNVLVDICKERKFIVKIDKRIMGRVIMNGSLSCVDCLYEMYAKLNECLVVEFNDELWLPLQLAAHRGDPTIVEHIIQYHGYELEPANSLRLENKLLNMNARIIKSQVNQLGVALKDIVTNVIPIIRNGNRTLFYVAIDFGADLCAQDENGYTGLHWAPRYFTPEHYHELMEYLIQSNKIECLEVVDKCGNTVLHRAILSLEVLPETLDLFKSRNVDFNAITDEKTENGNSVLHWAVQRNRSAEVIKKLVECGANVKATNKNGCGLLHFAADFGNVSAIPLLVSLGCNVKSVDKCQRIPLHYAFYNKADSLVEVVRLLVEHNSNVNAKGELGRTPLHYAVEFCKSSQVVSAIQFLILNGADVNVQDDEGNTMLLMPLQNQTPSDYHQIVQISEEASPASLKKRNNGELTSLHAAVRYLEIQSDTLQLLMKYVSINAVDNEGFPPLFYAIAGERSCEVIIMMIQQGADPKIRNNFQSNALHWAAMYGNVPALEYFLERGEIDINDKNKDGSTPLHCAFQIMLYENDHVHEVVRVLLEAGGNVNVKNSSGNSPLDVAVEREKNKEVDQRTVDLLMEDFDIVET